MHRQPSPRKYQKTNLRNRNPSPYAEGLSGVEQCKYLDLLFFHREKEMQLPTRIRTGETKGIFASRSPRRSNHIGATTVKLLRRDGNKLYVESDDALDGSPVILKGFEASRRITER